VKRILAVLLLAAILLTMFAVCGDQWREISPSEYGEVIAAGQLDRFEVDEKDVEWGVISINTVPYTVDFRANEEFNCETIQPGTWLSFSLDGNSAYNVRLAVFA